MSYEKAEISISELELAREAAGGRHMSVFIPSMIGVPAIAGVTTRQFEQDVDELLADFREQQERTDPNNSTASGISLGY